MCVRHRDGPALVACGDRDEIAAARSLFCRSQVAGQLDHAAGIAVPAPAVRTSGFCRAGAQRRLSRLRTCHPQAITRPLIEPRLGSPCLLIPAPDEGLDPIVLQSPLSHPSHGVAMSGRNTVATWRLRRARSG